MKEFKPLDEHEQDVVLKAAEVIKAAVEIPCTGCKYCVEGCPNNIAIPEYFSIINDEKQFGPNPRHKKSYAHLAETRGLASSCIECGQCESKCPQHLPIIETLKKVSKRYE